ncbi:MAG: hypothetical protein SGJ10_02095 [Bacteroidota bacterium]|nr:hypothetical protein [Bacteroidota bacterium]
MPNHFHMLVKIKDEGEVLEADRLSRRRERSERFFGSAGAAAAGIVSQKFGNFFNSYAKSINLQENRVGSLFQKPFRRKMIDSESYFTRIIAYIHCNPQLHGIANDFRKYPYSSYQTIIEAKSKLLKHEAVLEWFVTIENYIDHHEYYITKKEDEKWIIE